MAWQGQARHGVARPGLARQGGAWHGKARHGKDFIVIKDDRRTIGMKVNVSIEGTTPLLMNRFRDSSIEGKSTKKGEAKEHEVEDKLYLTAEGKPYIPSVYFWRAMIDAGKRLQVRGQKKATYSKIVGSVVEVNPDAIEIKGKWEAYRTSAVNPMTKGRMMVTRPMFNKWSCTFEVFVAGDEISPETINTLLTMAGQTTGIGDWRPEKKGKYGKFMVTKFQS